MSGMQTFDEADVNRETNGQFGIKPQSAPEVQLEVPLSTSQLMADFDARAEAAWAHVRALREPAVRTASALVLEDNPNAEAMLFVEDGYDDGSYLSLHSVRTSDADVPIDELDDEMVERVEGVIRSVANTTSDLAEFPSAYVEDDTTPGFMFLKVTR